MSVSVSFTHINRSGYHLTKHTQSSQQLRFVEAAAKERREKNKKKERKKKYYMVAGKSWDKLGKEKKEILDEIKAKA